MKKLLLIAIVLAAGWWYFIGGRKLSEDDINAFYRSHEAAMLQRRPEALCAMLSKDYQSVETMVVGGAVRTDSQDKAGACESMTQLYASWETLGDKMGGVLQLDSRYTIHSITLSPDRLTATVDISSSLDVAGSIMNIRARSTDTLIRRNGMVYLQRSEGRGSITAGS